MANKILIKKSSTQGAVPTTTQLDLAELAINTYDGRLFAKKTQGLTSSILDLKQNDPIRILGDATSSYAASTDPTEYASNVTMTLNTVNSNVGTFGDKTAGTITIPKVTVNAKGLVTAVETFTYSAGGDLGTMATQNANAVAITGGTINGTSIGATTPSTGVFTDLSVTNTLGVAGSADIQTLDVNAALTVGTTITATGNINAQSELNVTGNAIIGKDLIVNGDLTVKGTTTTVNSTTVAIGDLNIELAKDSTSAVASTGGGITVHGPTTAATITYDGSDDTWNLNKKLKGTDATFSGTFNASGAATFGSTLTVSGATNLNTVNTTGTATFDNLVVNNAAAVGTTLTVGSTATVNSLTTNTSASIGSTLGVTGASTLNTVTAASLQATAIGNVTPGTGAFTTLTASSTFNASGAATLGSTLNVASTTTTNDLAVNNAGTFGTTVNVAGTATVNGLAVNTSATIGTTLGVSGVATFDQLVNANGGIAVDTNKFTVADATGDTYIDGNLNVHGWVDFDSTLNVDGASTFRNSVTSIGGDVTVKTSGGTTMVTVAASSGDIHTEGNVDIAKKLTVAGDVNVNSGKFTVTATTGDVHTDGKLTSTGNIEVNTNKFVVNGATGDTLVGGNLTVQGTQSTFGGLSVSDLTTTRIVFVGSAGRLVDSANLTWDGSKFYVNGKGEFTGNITTTSIAAYTTADYTTGALQVAGDASIAGKIQVQGTIYTGGYQVLDTQSTIDGGTY